MKPFGKHSDMVVQSQQPFNAESSPYLLRQSLVTPKDLFYVRNHGSYRLFPPYVTEEPDDFSESFALGEVSVNAVICRPSDGASVQAGSVHFQGYALAGGGRDIERVDLSPDEGRTWVGADLSEGDSPWAWRLWEATVELGPGSHRIVARALDSAADTQPQDARGVWNFKGYANNAWHRVEVNAR